MAMRIDKSKTGFFSCTFLFKRLRTEILFCTEQKMPCRYIPDRYVPNVKISALISLRYPPADRYRSLYAKFIHGRHEVYITQREIKRHPELSTLTSGYLTTLSLKHRGTCSTITHTQSDIPSHTFPHLASIN